MKTASLDILEKAQLPPAQARAILRVMEAELASDTLATKADLSDIKADLRILKSEMKSMASKEDLKSMATKAELSDVKAELMRWMFVFWVGQMAATFAIIKFLK